MTNGETDETLYTMVTDVFLPMELHGIVSWAQVDQKYQQDVVES